MTTGRDPPIEDPLETLVLIRGVYFDWDESHGGKRDVGMIAEEVGKVLPEILVYEPYHADAAGMDHSNTTRLLVESIKAMRGERPRHPTVRSPNACPML